MRGEGGGDGAGARVWPKTCVCLLESDVSLIFLFLSFSILKTNKQT